MLAFVLEGVYMWFFVATEYAAAITHDAAISHTSNSHDDGSRRKWLFSINLWCTYDVTNTIFFCITKHKCQRSEDCRDDGRWIYPSDNVLVHLKIY